MGTGPALPPTPGRQALRGGEPGGRCLSYGGTMPDGRVRLCSGDRWHRDSHTYEFGLAESAPAPDLDHDPAALAWARAKVLEVTGQWRDLAARLAESDMEKNAEKWRKIAVIVENALAGGKTDDVLRHREASRQLAAFDERHATKEQPNA